jgi:hypothetical protein
VRWRLQQVLGESVNSKKKKKKKKIRVLVSHQKMHQKGKSGAKERGRKSAEIAEEYTHARINYHYHL